MATLNQIRCTWSGVTGLPGISTFYATGDPSFLIARLKTFFEAVKTSIPTGITIAYPSSGITVDTATGQANGAWSSTTTASTSCTATGTYQAPTGAVVNWKTGVYVNGRELRGKTFLVPLANGAFGSDGKLLSTNVTSFTTAAAAVPGGGNPLVVWSKTAAANAPVTSATVPAKVAVLRSRRD